MKKIVTLFILMITLTFTVLFGNKIIVNAADDLKIIVHYHRFDNNYQNWDLWIWQNQPTPKDGKEFEFTSEDEFGKVAEISISEIADYDALNPSTKVGFIIREGSWDAGREPGGDRFIDLSNPDENNEVHVYIITNDETVYTDRASADVSPQFSSASFSSFTTINFTTTEAVINSLQFQESIYVLENGLEMDITNVKINADNKSGSLTLKDTISFENDYLIGSCNFSKDLLIVKSKLFDSDDFSNRYVYDGDDLGAIYTQNATKFKVWAPTASKVEVVLYDTGDYRNGLITDTFEPTDLKDVLEMNRSEKGTWSLKVNEDLNGVYYTYKVTFGTRSVEAVDPYAKAVGVNGHRGMVVDLEGTNPERWLEDKPEFINYNDAIIYELHIRDLSIHSSSNIQNKGKYLGLIESGTKYKSTKTGLDHLKDLGITHLHLLPSFDHRSIDETNLDTPQFNWGYDPLNFNVPEGSYSSDPTLGEVRVNEFKQMVQGLHDNDIRVVMDVVYNHLGDAASSSFEKIVPGYYFRYDNNGGYTNGSGVGNETASDREMFRKFMIDSLKYWATEYNIDGFRFDLMAVHDIETMNLIREALNEIDPTILIYGEGWTGGSTPLPESEQALRTNVSKMPGIAVFNDITRDGTKGSVWSDTDKGFIQGSGHVQDVMFGIVGGIEHPDTNKYWALSPNQIVNYVEAHDNLTLWNKLALSAPDVSENARINMDKQAAAIVLTSQGIPFLHAGQDFLRSKVSGGTFEHNSYNAPDKVNQLRWDYKDENYQVYDYYKGLINLRKNHPAFKMGNAEEINEKLRFFDTGVDQVIGYTINGAKGEVWDKIVILFNGNTSGKRYVNLPEEGTYNIVVDLARAGTETIRTISGSGIELRANESIVMYMTDDATTPDITDEKTDISKIMIGVSIGVILLAGAGVSYIYFKKKS
ncbi:type I pullulanase [Mycoplasmatota bacterium]|nr:type I pullulanase [Mycoplasmatota bacterium]